jgi:hypothetical protein
MADRTDVEYNPKPGEQVVPVTEFSDENIRAIPLGSEVVIVNMQDHTVEAGLWNEEMVENVIAARDMNGRAEMESVITFFHVPVLDVPADVVKSVMEDHASVLADADDKLGRYHLTGQDLVRLLLSVAVRAQAQRPWDGRTER